MSLELVTGPANAEKAGVVLDRTRQLASAGADPILVVPTRPDVLAFRRELAADGLVFGVRVETFSGLSREMAARTGRAPGGAPAIVRLRVAEAAVAATRLDALAASAATPGFTAAFAGLCGELTEARIGPGLWYTAVRAWGEEQPARAQYAEELGALYGAYRDRIERAGGDPATRAYELHDALRLDPAAWGGVPVLFYGFDDFTDPELDAIRTLALVDAPVVVSLPYEDGREDVYRARGRTLAELPTLAGDRHVQLPPRAEEDPALAHLERSLLTLDPARPDAGEGFQIVLSADVPKVVEEHLRADVDDFLGARGLTRADIASWVCHPGGPKVLEAMEKALETQDDALELTWRSLREVGNLSSTSVLLVLEATLAGRRPPAGSLGMLLALGPGFCSELVLLRW